MINFPTVNKERDNILSDWGPYSKNLAGISHIEDKESGMMLEFSVFPTQYRGITQVPIEIYQGNYMPWFAAKDLSGYGYRFQLEWKDRVYADISYSRQEDDSILIKADCVNNTEMPQNIALHYLVNRTCPESTEISVKDEAYIIDALTYQSINIASDNIRDGLTYDGKLICEVIDSEYYHGHALGDLFGKTKGDLVTYQLRDKIDNADTVYIHAKGNGNFQASGITNAEFTINSDILTVYAAEITDSSEDKLDILCEGGTGIVIDCIILGTAMNPPAFEKKKMEINPEVIEENHQLTIKYKDIDTFYGIAWQGENYQVREFRTRNIEYLMPYMTHDHVNNVIGSDDKGNYTNIFIRPILLKPKETVTLYGSIAFGDEQQVNNNQSKLHNANISQCYHIEKPSPISEENEYALSQQLMQATLLTNVVFPVRLQGNYIRHFTPGKWWDSLYTWDNGFIAWAFAELAPQLAEDCLNTYLTEAGNCHAAFVHHGSMLPIQAYVYKEIYDKSNDRLFLKKYYPSMRQYYDFYLGHSDKSHTNMQSTGLLRTFDYFYNSGGWDDYPPQKQIGSLHKEKSVSPVVNTAHAINFARIMINVAEELELDSTAYREDIERLKSALQKYSYDKESGYFSYVEHDSSGMGTRFLKSENGENYNMGLDGAYPFMADACTKEQREQLVEYIMSPERMWTDIGISVVDQSAQYFSNDGYWNGSVWMPHQWLVFLAMLEFGYDDFAIKIAVTALNLWKNETDYSYHCYEHFMIQSKRGAGWHCFGGLSSPVLMWYNSFYKEGTITVPINFIVISRELKEKSVTFNIRSCQSSDGTSTILVVISFDKYHVTVNGKLTDCKSFGKAVLVKASKNISSKIVIIAEE